ncbi:MAG: histidine phosphatase family protein [Clostridia bacterium]|nr:histidine phosphatase family protein [Clostridia bacterium]
MDLIYLRHGQTDWNKQGKLQGRTDIPLNENGIFGARSAGEVLSRYHFDAIYCSPLIRAQQTLQHACPSAVPILDERLSEWSFGPLEGQPVPSDFYSHRWFFGQPPILGMEQIEDVVARVCEFYAEIKQKHPQGTVLVVSHGGVSAAMHCAVYGIPKNENLSRYCLPNSMPVLFREGHPPVILHP